MNAAQSNNTPEVPPPTFVQRYGLISLICLLFFGGGLLRLNDYSFLTPDSSLYLIWGNALAHGQGFVDYTQPVPDRYVSRGMFYSVMIAPVEAVFPHSLTAVKVFTLSLGVLSLIVFHSWLARKVGITGAAIGTIMLAFNPLLLIYGTEVLSEIPFLCLALIAAILVERLTDVPDGNNSVWGGFALGLCLAAVGLLRDIGMAFLIAAILSLFILRRWKQIMPVVMMNVLLLGLWFIRNKFLVHQTGFSQTGYLPWFFSRVGTPESAHFTKELWWRISTSGSIYLSQFGGTLLYPLFSSRQFVPLLQSIPHFYSAMETGFPLWSRFVIVISVPLLMFGVFRDLRDYNSGLYRFGGVLLYLGIVLCFPFNDIRYHVPLLPFFIYYIISGAAFVGEHLDSIRQWFTHRKVIGIALICMIPNALGMAFIISNNLSSRQAPTQPWPEMEAWIRAHLPEDAVIVCPVKDLAPEIGNRKLINVDPTLEKVEFEKLLRDNSVSCIVTPLLYGGGTMYEFNLRESRRFRFDTLHTAGALIAWSVSNGLQEQGEFGTALGDNSPRHAPVVAARNAILSGQYRDALNLLRPLVAAQPDRADVLYQMLIASSFLRDTSEVTRLYNTIVSLPSWSSIFIIPAQRHMEALNAVLAIDQTGGIEKALRANEAASMYWRLGYSRVATQLMNETTLPDSAYFVGLLWGMHYNLQSGDTAKAREYMRLLHGIDRTNAVVLAFDSVFGIGDRLRHSSSPGEASALHLDVARIYERMELHEEALDEADRAIGLNHRNDAAMVFLGRIFESRTKYGTAERWYQKAITAAPSNSEAHSGADRAAILLKAQMEK